jgi:hypothetical protein
MAENEMMDEPMNNDTFRENIEEVRILVRSRVENNPIITRITHWDTSLVTDMSMLNLGQFFNRPLDWNTERVTNMANIFYGCTNFNSSITFSNTERVTNMTTSFFGCTNFNQPLDFDTSRVMRMDFMFKFCRNFNQPLDWNTERVTNMAGMFHGCTNFNQPLDFDTSLVTHMYSMFCDCSNFNQNITHWNTINVMYYANMFDYANEMPEEFKPTFRIPGETVEDYLERRNRRIEEANAYEEQHFPDRFRKRLRDSRSGITVYTETTRNRATPLDPNPEPIHPMRYIMGNRGIRADLMRKKITELLGPSMPARGGTKRKKGSKSRKSKRIRRMNKKRQISN